jgi:inorganic pyrophosphatase
VRTRLACHARGEIRTSASTGIHSAVYYPGDYGFLPRTLGDDGDPLDLLVLMTIPVFSGCLVDARPIGLFHLVDRGAADEKVLAVPMGESYSDGLNDLDDISQHYLKEIEQFFFRCARVSRAPGPGPGGSNGPMRRGRLLLGGWRSTKGLSP